MELHQLSKQCRLVAAAFNLSGASVIRTDIVGLSSAFLYVPESFGLGPVKFLEDKDEKWYLAGLEEAIDDLGWHRLVRQVADDRLLVLNALKTQAENILDTLPGQEQYWFGLVNASQRIKRFANSPALPQNEIRVLAPRPRLDASSELVRLPSRPIVIREC